MWGTVCSSKAKRLEVIIRFQSSSSSPAKGSKGGWDQTVDALHFRSGHCTHLLSMSTGKGKDECQNLEWIARLKFLQGIQNLLGKQFFKMGILTVFDTATPTVVVHALLLGDLLPAIRHSWGIRAFKMSSWFAPSPQNLSCTSNQCCSPLQDVISCQVICKPWNNSSPRGDKVQIIP